MRRSSTLLLRASLFLLLIIAHEAAAADIEELTLDSGMQVILIPRPGCGLIASNVFVGAGSTREEERYAGSSHFLEHLLFNGTERRTQEEIYAFEDRIGAYNNATTKREYTHFMMVAPRERMRDALDLQSDMLLHSVLPPEKFEKERGIVVEEIVKDCDDPDYRISTALDSMLHEGDPPFARKVLGSAATIAALPRDVVLEYYRRQYQPRNMRMVLMGDFQRDEALAMIGELFVADDDDRLPPLPAPPLRLDGPASWQTKAVDAPGVSARLAAVLEVADAREHAALALLVEVLGGGGQNRLQQVMDAEPAVTAESVSASALWMGGSTLLELDANLPAGADLEVVLSRLGSALASLVTLDPGELEAARTRLLSAEISQFEQLHYYALYHGDRLWAMDRGFLPAYLDALEDLTADEVQDYAQRIVPSLTLHFTAAGSGLSDASRALADSVVDAALVRQLQSPPATPVAIPTRQRPPHLTEAQAPRLTRLENGMIFIHAADPHTRMVALHLLVKNRSAREPAEREGLADILHRLLPETGASALQDRIGAELKVADNPWIPFDDYYTTPLYSFVRLSTTDDFYRESIPYLAWMCTREFDDAKALERVRAQLQGVLMRQKGSSRAICRQRFNELLYPGHPLSHSTLPSMELLPTVTLDEIEFFARDYLAPPNLIVAMVGDVPWDEALRRVCEAFDTEPIKGEVEEAGPPPPPLTLESRREQQELGGQQSNLRMGRVVQVQADDRWALEVAVMIASARMQQDLRETRGLAYRLSIGASFLDDRAAIVAQMGTQPKNLEEAESAVRGYLTAGELQVSEDEIATAVNARLGRLRMRTVTSMGRAFTLCRDEFLSGDIDEAAREAAGLSAVGVDDVARASRRYLGEGPLVTVTVR